MTTLNLIVADGDDDAWERDNTTGFTSTAAVVSVIGDASSANRRNGGMRFTGVTIPPGSTINSAVMTVAITSSTFDDPKLFQHFEAADDAVDFATNATVTGRTVTTASGSWEADAIGTGDRNAPDCSAALQEVIDRAGWTSGNAINAVWKGKSTTGLKSFSCTSYDGSSSTCARIAIDYTESAPDPAEGSGIATAIAGAAAQGYAAAAGSGTAPTIATAVATGYHAAQGSGESAAIVTALATGYHAASGYGIAEAIATAIGEGYAVAAGSGVAEAVVAAVAQGHIAAVGSGTAEATADAEAVGYIVASGSGECEVDVDTEAVGYATAAGSGEATAIADALAVGYIIAAGSVIAEAVATAVGVGESATIEVGSRIIVDEGGAVFYGDEVGFSEVFTGDLGSAVFSGDESSSVQPLG